MARHNKNTNCSNVGTDPDDVIGTVLTSKELSEIKKSVVCLETDGGEWVFEGKHHARYIDPNLPHHVISRVFQGRCLLKPSPELNNLVAGVLGRAERVYPKVQLFAYAFMSNHVHLIMRGPPDEFAGFVGFVKREICRRYAPAVRWSGTLWHGYTYLCAALPSALSQIQSFQYVLAQGVKENLVERPEEWPGVHIAKQLVLEQKLEGEWFDGSRYGNEVAHQNQRAHPQKPARAKFVIKYEVLVTQLPALAHLSRNEYVAEVKGYAEAIVRAARRKRGDKRVLGVMGIYRTPLWKRYTLKRPPCFKERRRRSCWEVVDGGDETTEYLYQYWDFQYRFRRASDSYLGGERNAVFPEGAFRPGLPARWRDKPPLEKAA